MKSFKKNLILFLALVTLSIPAMASDLEETRVLANQGDAKAQYSLGSIYDEGDGVPEDNTKAIMWYTKAANQGHAKLKII